MYQYMAKGKFDTVICTHVLSAVMLPHMHKPFPLALKTAMIMTVYTCYPGMEATDLQMYFIPDGSLAEEFVKRGIAREKIAAAGIPVCRGFYKKKPGGLSVTEAAVKKLPMALINASGSCSRKEN